MGDRENKTRVIDIDASDWRTSQDNSILPALGAPDWHGDSSNALVESMVWGEINTIEPPYILRVHSTRNLPADVAEELGWVKDGVDRARVEVTVEILK